MTRIPKCITSFFLISLLLFSSVSCTQPQANAPSGSDPAPEPAIMSGDFTVSIFTNQEAVNAPAIQKSAAYLQKLLNGKGWDININIEGVSDDLDFVKAVKADTAAGAMADGYIVPKIDAIKLLDNRFSQDVGKLVQESTPILYNRFKTFFQGSAAGLPLTVGRSKRGGRLVLHIQKELAANPEQPLITINDILSLLEKNDTMKIGVEEDMYSFSYASTVMDAWAVEQGYFPLSKYYIEGGLYTGFNDRQCTLVPVENIPDFESFFARSLKLLNSRRLVGVSDNERMASKDVVGYIGDLKNGMNSVLLSSHQKSGKDYVAIPLTGYTVPVLPEDEPKVGMVMAVSSTSTKAEQIVRFVQWALTDRDGYDLVSYGAKDVDYRLDGMRLEYLNNGKALVPEDWDPLTSSAFFMRNVALCNDDMMERIKAYAPENYAELLLNNQTSALPVWDVLEHLGATPMESRGLFHDVVIEFDALITNRRSLFQGTISEEHGNGVLPYSDSAICLTQLRALSKDTTKLINAYQARIMQVLNGQAK